MNSDDALDELMGEVKVRDTSLTENSLTSKERRKRWWESLKKSIDWAKLPFHILIGFVLIIGAILMATSVYSMTKNLAVAIFSPAFTELGLIAAHWAGDRPKNSVRQAEIAKRLRGWHVFTTVILMVSNLLIDTAVSILDIKIDGIIYFVYGIIGFTALIDIVNYFMYQDADDELISKHDIAKRLEGIKSQTLISKMNAYADAEEIKSKAFVQFYEEHAPALAREQALVEAATDLKRMYLNLGGTKEDALNLLSSLDIVDNNPPETSENNKPPRPYNKTGAYSKKNLPTPQTEKGETNFPSGTTSEETKRAIAKLKEANKNQEV